MTALKRTITVGTVTLTLKKNREVFDRYEGFTEHTRVLVSQQPWGAWQGTIVKREGRGAMVTSGDRYWTPEEAGAALLESAAFFCLGLEEFTGKAKPPKSEEMGGSVVTEDSGSNGNDDELTLQPTYK